MNHAKSTSGKGTWRIAGAYLPLLRFDRPAWAAECLRRDPSFVYVVLHRTGPTPRILRTHPVIALMPLEKEDELRGWGIHFRSASRQAGRAHARHMVR